MSVYQGHCADGSSVQKHSAGATYPYVIGYTDGNGYFVLTPSGIQVDCGKFSTADALAVHFKSEYDQGLRH
jgi:hypothetical protein